MTRCAEQISDELAAALVVRAKIGGIISNLEEEYREALAAAAPLEHFGWAVIQWGTKGEGKVLAVSKLIHIQEVCDGLKLQFGINRWDNHLEVEEIDWYAEWGRLAHVPRGQGAIITSRTGKRFTVSFFLTGSAALNYLERAQHFWTG